MEKRDVVVYSEDYKKLVDATALKDKYYEIDERVEEICKEAFKGCDRLKEIVMPKKLKKIDSEAFRGCTGLVKITSLAGIPPVCDSEVFDGVNKTNCELIVPEGSVAAYTRAEGWNEFSNIRGFSGVEVTVAGKTRKIVVE
jgi:cell surface protein|uniref:leucine-rich repeat protein n=1 Tax=Candidatus Limisoma sp. TaxID=3076476 RepID=UPI004026A23A